MVIRIIAYFIAALFVLFLRDPSLGLAKELVIVFSGDTAGALEPCGCSSRKGGVARRAAFIDKTRKENDRVIVLDCGDMFLKDRKPGELRAKYMARVMGLMEYDAVNVGDDDFGFGVDFLSDLAKSNRIPLVSANVGLRRDDGGSNESCVLPYRVIRLDGVNVGVTGITPELFFKDRDVTKNLTINSNLSEAIIKVVSEMRIKTDLMILLSHLGSDATRNFIEMNDLDGVSVVIAGHGRHMTFEPKRAGSRYIVQNSMSGESIGVLRVNLDSKKQIESCQLENVILSPDMPENEKIAQIVREFDLEAAKLDEEERKNKEKAEAAASAEKILKLSPGEFVEKMKTSQDGTVPMQ